MRTQGTVKIRNLSALPEVVAEFGVDLGAILSKMALDDSLFGNHEHIISYASLGRLLRECVEATGSDELGLRIGMRQSIPILGLSGYVAANAPTVREALETIIASLRLSDTGGRASLHSERGFASLRWVIADPSIEAAEHIDDAVMAIACNILRALRGPQWRPIEACFTRPRPKSAATYLKFFNSPLRFETDVACLHFEEADLDMAVHGRDANLHEILSPLLEQAMAESKQSVTDAVRDILRSQTLSGALTPDRAAAALGISARTLSRRLASEDASFSDLAQQVRIEAAQRLLRSEKSIADIATALGYSDATAFIRAFRHLTGTTPARWRRGA